MSFLLDTDICSAHLKGNAAVFNRFIQYSGRLSISMVSVGELFTWAIRSRASANRFQSLADLWNDVTLLGVDFDIAKKFGEIRASRLDQGLGTPEVDLIIAATAIVHDLTVVTHNASDFAGTGVRMQDWLGP